MPDVEHPLDHGERAFPRRPLPVDTPVPQPIPDAQRVAPCPTPHGGAVAPELHTEVSLVPVHHLPGPTQINPAVVDAGGGRLQVPDEAEVDISLGVQLEPIAGSASLLRPRAVPAPPGLGLLSPRLIRGCMTRVGRDERGVLDDALLDAEPLFVELALQLLPDSQVPAGFGEALPELPHRTVVGSLLGEAEEPLVTDAVRHLSLQLGV